MFRRIAEGLGISTACALWAVLVYSLMTPRVEVKAVPQVKQCECVIGGPCECCKCGH